MSLNESQLRELLDRYLKGTATDEERKIADDFFASYAAEQSGEDPINISRKKQEIFLRIRERIAPRVKKPLYLQPWFKVAAAVSLVMVSLWFFNRVTNQASAPENHFAVAVKTERANRGEKLILELPDGSKVHINSNSSISYPSTFGKTRTITLQGEAYFDVTHDPSRPFTVHAGSSAVNVLGTSFNVKATPSEEVEVTLVTGKVNVNSSSHELSIEPGYQAVVGANSVIRAEKVNVADFVSWKDNVLVFRETPLEDAVVMLGDWYDAKVEIQSSALKGCTISGEYKNESLENVIRSFEFLLKAKADFKDEKNITLSGTGCKLN